jgi:glucose-1-phosphate thymidylyltransferase
VHTNQRILEFVAASEPLISKSHTNTGSVIIKPCFIGENVTLINATVGPHVSIGNNTHVENSVIKNSIIQENTKIYRSNIVNSMVGSHAELHELNADLSVGDYTVIKTQ